MTGKIDSTAWEKVKRALSSRFRGGITRVGGVYDDATLETQYCNIEVNGAGITDPNKADTLQIDVSE